MTNTYSPLLLVFADALVFGRVYSPHFLVIAAQPKKVRRVKSSKKMFNLSAESFPEDSIIVNISHNTHLPPITHHALETLPILSQLNTETTDASGANIETAPTPPVKLQPVSDASAVEAGASINKSSYTKSLTNTSSDNRRIGGAFKRAALSKKSASVDSLHYGGAAAANKKFGVTMAKRLATNRGYEHVQSKVKADIDSARQHENQRRAKFQRHQSMPETLCPDGMTSSVAEEEYPPDEKLVSSLREQIVAKDRMIAEKNLLIMQLNSLHESAEMEGREKLKLQRKIEAMRMEILKVIICIY